ncbi:MAG: hypothetical protein K8R58_08825, partial [Bacteroidales bacterium]|nr:hypothetical protein [Bacteroidales bacterium]
MDIPDNTYNPQTHTTVQDGDEIPLWSYEETTGEWSYEKTGTIIWNNKGKFEIKSELSHLSYWNWDWYWEDVCYNGAYLLFNSSHYSPGDIVELLLIAYKAEDATFMTATNLTATIGETLQLLLVPSLVPTYFIIYDIANNGNMQTGIFADLCLGTYEINLDEMSVPPNISADVTVMVSGYCPNKPEIIVYPSLGYWYREISPGNTDWIYGYMVNGRAILRNALYKTFEFVFYYDGNLEEYIIPVTNQTYIEKGVELTSEMCDLFQY